MYAKFILLLVLGAVHDYFFPSVAGGQLAIAPIIAASLIGGGAGLGAALLGKKKTTKQVPLISPEQRAAQSALLAFGQTGQIGDFRVGEEVPLEFGDFNATDIEKQGLTGLEGLLASGQRAGFQQGDAALQDFLATDQEAIDRQFEPFKARANRELEDARTNFKRSKGFAGDLFSADTFRGLGDIEARGQETLIGELARLSGQARQQRLQAIPLAFQSAQAQEGQDLGRIQASQQFGGLIRQLNDAAAKSRDTELLRRRKELQLPLQALSSVAGVSAPFGVPEITTSPFQDFLKLAGQVGGQALTNRLSRRSFPAGEPGIVPFRGAE